MKTMLCSTYSEASEQSKIVNQANLVRLELEIIVNQPSEIGEK